MSVTLSDRLTRGTYLVDYGPSLGAYRAAECSFPIHGMTMRSNSRASSRPETLCTNLLESIYPKADISGFTQARIPSRK